MRHAPLRGTSRMILVGDLNVAPLEHDVWSHKQMLRVVSHTPLECEKLVAVQKEGGWIDAMRMLTPEPTKLYTWWSYRSPDWERADKGRRLDHIWVGAGARRPAQPACGVLKAFARLVAALRTMSR
jgi:exodeoxyribonuclease-3